MNEKKRIQIGGKLQQVIAGQVLCRDNELIPYSHDQSIYEKMPTAVVIPAELDDIRQTLQFCREEGLSFTARGGGSGTAGSALGKGIVLSLPRQNCLSNLTVEQAGSGIVVRSGAGVYNDDLQQVLKAKGFYLPADPTSAKICQIGGNIATKASGPHAYRYGAMDRFIRSLEFFTANGQWVDTADPRTIPDLLLNAVTELQKRVRTTETVTKILEARKNIKTSSGYNLFALLEDLSPGQLLARLVAGSVGTLVYVTGACLKVEPYCAEKKILLLTPESMHDAVQVVEILRNFDIDALELINRESLELLAERGNQQLAGLQAQLLFAEFSGARAQAAMDASIKALARAGVRFALPPITEAKSSSIQSLWQARKQIYPYLMQLPSHLKALSVVNDVGIPPERLAGAVTDLQAAFEKRQLKVFIYGHAGNGNLHLRPIFDLRTPGLDRFIEGLAEEVYAIVLRYGGTVTAEHGMGPLRAPFLCREWGDEICGIMQEIKQIFDPADMLNPGAVFGPAPLLTDIQPAIMQFQDVFGDTNANKSVF